MQRDVIFIQMLMGYILLILGVVPEAKKLDSITMEEMLEMAGQGAKGCSNSCSGIC